MSFDLYIFDSVLLPEGGQAINELLETTPGEGQPPTVALSAFVDEIESLYPMSDENPDDSPWASWPLTDFILDGRCMGLNIVWSRAEEVSRVIIDLCRERGLTVWDPQDDKVLPPAERGHPTGDKSESRKRWWRRGNN